MPFIFKRISDRTLIYTYLRKFLEHWGHVRISHEQCHMNHILGHFNTVHMLTTYPQVWYQSLYDGDDVHFRRRIDMSVDWNVPTNFCDPPPPQHRISWKSVQLFWSCHLLAQQQAERHGHAMRRVFASFYYERVKSWERWSFKQWTAYCSGQQLVAFVLRRVYNKLQKCTHQLRHALS